MATIQATQATKIANASLGTYAPLLPGELGGRLRVAYFSHTTTASGNGTVVGDIIQLTKLPARSRVVDFAFLCEDIGAATATLGIGDTGDSDRLVSAIAISAAVAHRAASTILRTGTTEEPDLGWGYLYTTETWISATIQTAAIDAVGQFWGYIVYFVD
jgi:hypothetical protein